MTEPLSKVQTVKIGKPETVLQELSTIQASKRKGRCGMTKQLAVRGKLSLVPASPAKLIFACAPRRQKDRNPEVTHRSTFMLFKPFCAIRLRCIKVPALESGF